MNRVIILDRDGVINRDSMDYIKSPDEFVMLPGSAEAIARLTDAGYRIAVVTNQSGVARGYYDEAQLQAIHEKMFACVQDAGGRIDALEYCTHMPSALCACRKPNPGMLYAIAKRFDCSLIGVPFVGDRISDIEAGLAVGAKPIVVMSQMTDKKNLANYPNVPTYPSLAQYVNSL